jgi:hypothetical protein
MKIQMEEKMRPFSHLPGAHGTLPKSFWKIQAFPSLLLFESPKGEKIQIAFRLSGRMEGFTLFEDLFRGELEMTGKIGGDFLRLFLKKEGEKIGLFVKKAPKEGIECKLLSPFPYSPTKTDRVFSGQTILFDVKEKEFSVPPLERFFLGSHKKMDMDLIKRRKDPKEIFPLWFLFSQWLPSLPESTKEGVGLLLNRSEELLKKKEKRELEKELLFLWDCGFSSLFVPHLDDPNHLLSFEKLSISSNANPLILLKEGAKILRSLFLEEKEEKVFLLPTLLPSCVSGVLQKMHLSFGLLDLEWRAHVPRRAVIASHEAHTLSLICPKPISSYRIRRSNLDRGKRILSGDLLKIEKDEVIFFDRFEK